MRIARKLFLLGAMALAAMAMTAGAASAEGVIVYDEAMNHCGDVTIDVHQVDGGCHVEVESEEDIPLYAHLGPPLNELEISNCEVFLEAQLGEDGEGYITEADLTPPDEGTVPCTRAPCDEADGTMLPWAIHFNEVDGVETVEATFCLRTIQSGPGGAGTPCTVHLPWENNGGHHYEIGDSGHTAEYACENPAVPVEIQAHFLSLEDELGEEEIEIVHTP
jgi:hypothetical protein